MLARLLTLLATGAFLALLALDRVLRRDVDPLQHPISNYGRGEHAWIFALALAGLALGKAGVGLWLLPSSNGALRSAGLILLVDASATLLVALFPTDLGEQTAVGTVHKVAATIAFLSSAAATLTASFATIRAPGGTALTAIAVLGAVSLLLFGIALWGSGPGGLAERGQVVCTAVWLLLVAGIRMG